MSALRVSFCAFRPEFFSYSSLISLFKLLFRASSCESLFVIEDTKSESFEELDLAAGFGGCCDARAAPTFGILGIGDRCYCDPLTSLLFSRGCLAIGMPPVGTNSGLLGCKALAPSSLLMSSAMFLATPVSSSSEALSRSKLSAMFHLPCLN